MALAAWAKTLAGRPFGARDVTWMAVGSACICAYGVFFGRARIRTLKHILLGMEGEITVGAMLEDLRTHHSVVMHDVPIVSSTGKTSKGISGLLDTSSVVANIDHVAIGPAGVCAFETKTRSKPGDNARPARITVDANGTLLVAGYPHEPDPRAQARRTAGELGRIIERRTNERVVPRPVVVFPDWWVEESMNPKGTSEGAWVLNPSRVFAWMSTQARIVSSDGRTLDTHAIKRIAAARTDHVHAHSN